MTNFSIHNISATKIRLIYSPTAALNYVKSLKSTPARDLSPTADTNGFLKPITEEGE